MKVLAFDTSSKALSLAILEDKQLLAETTINIKKNHSITLMPAIDFLMASLDLTPKDLGRIVVAEGPGSYWLANRSSNCQDLGSYLKH